MATYTFLGECPASMKPVFIESYGPSDNRTKFTVQTISEYKKSGIYSAQRDDTTQPVVIDWGDGTVEQVNGDVSQKVHTYATVDTFEVTVSNVKTFAASINDYAWYNTTSQNQYTLTEVELGSSVTSIVDNAFCSCSKITSVTIPDSVTSIGERAFNDCYFITSVSIPDSVTSIGNLAFIGCTFTSVIIPNSVTSIGYAVFAYCTSLTSVTFQGKTISQVQSMANYDFGINERDYTQSGLLVTVVCSDGSFTITTSCLLKGTDILLADGTSKKIENLTYNDTLKVWDFDEGQLGSAKVCWLTRPGLKSNHYYQLTFDNGTILKTTGINSNHRIFSVDQSKFTNVCDAKAGDKVFSIDGTLTITDAKYVEEECEYYNVMTSGKINCFANGILTSDRYGNLYPISNMKYVKDGRQIRPYSEYEAVGIDRYWYDNLRLGENDETIEKSKEYVWKCLGQMLPLPAQS